MTFGYQISEDGYYELYCNNDKGFYELFICNKYNYQIIRYKRLGNLKRFCKKHNYNLIGMVA